MPDNIIIDFIGTLILVVILLARRAQRQGDALRRRLSQALMVCCLLVFVTDIPGLALDGRSFDGARALIWAFDTAYWIVQLAYCWLWLMFFDYSCFGSTERLRRRALIYALPMLAGLVLIASNPLTGWLFTISAANVYVNGSAYYLCLIPYYLYVAASLLLALRGCRADGEQKRRCLMALTYMLLPLAGIAMEFFTSGVSWAWVMCSLSLLMVHLNSQQQIIADERLLAARAAEEAARMDVELTGSRISIMLSQIQPHFLYNSLCVIQDLCHGKAPEAEQATIAFSRFLRGNLDSLKADKPISFAQELKHTQYYLTLERMRFNARLRVEYDIETDAFQIPSLTLQPIVENAIRYGVMKRESGGTVKLETREDANGFVVTITDDGVGFDPFQKHDDGRTHIGIDNVRQRLRDMCGGSLSITSARGRGTVAVITLPRSARLDA